jgi:predicted DNA binding protein
MQEMRYIDKINRLYPTYNVPLKLELFKVSVTGNTLTIPIRSADDDLVQYDIPNKPNDDKVIEIIKQRMLSHIESFNSRCKSEDGVYLSEANIIRMKTIVLEALEYLKK